MSVFALKFFKSLFYKLLKIKIVAQLISKIRTVLVNVYSIIAILYNSILPPHTPLY